MAHTEYGVFLPIAAGGWLISDTAPYPPADYDYNKRAAIMAEQMGLDFIMAQAKWRGFGGSTDHWGESIESMTMMAALAEATERVKVWATVHANLVHPALAAKIYTTLQQISHGRAGMNIVNGAYAGEFRQMGVWDEDMTHEERYAMTEEWTQAVTRLWSEDSVDLDGDFFTLTACESRPHPATRPTIISAGRSERGREFQATYADGAFLDAPTIEQMREIAVDVHERAEAKGRTCNAYAMLTVVLAETDAAARQRVDLYAEGVDRVALANMRQAWGWDEDRAMAWAEGAKGTEAFQTPYVAGSAETVAAHILSVVDGAALDGLMLIFPDYMEDMPAFGEYVLPLLRAHDGQQA